MQFKQKLCSFEVIALLVLGMFAFLPLIPLVKAAGITLVQGPARRVGIFDAGTFNVTLSQTPINGNALILCYAGGDYLSNPYVTSVNQTGVTWSQQAAVNGNGVDVEIWFGVVGAYPTTLINITVTGGSGGTGECVADVCEWSGIATSNYLDQIAINSNGGEGDGTYTTVNTGITAATTQANELWIGAIGGGNNPAGTESTPTNGFTLLDGLTTGTQYHALGYLYNVVSSTGAASTGITWSSTMHCAGCIATFFAISPSSPDSLSVSLTSPSNGVSQYSTSVTFTYNVTCVGDTIQNASLWTNSGGTWANVENNDTDVLNNTSNSFSYTLPAGTFIWNIKVFKSTAGVFAPSNYTITILQASSPNQLVLYENFENWNVNGWYPIFEGGTASLESSIVYGGDYALNSSLPANSGYRAFYDHNLPPNNPYCMRVYLYIRDFPTTDINGSNGWNAAIVYYGFGDDGTYGYGQIGVALFNGTVHWAMSNNYNTYPDILLNSTYPQLNTWTETELDVYQGNGNGWVAFYVNGVLQYNATGLTNNVESIATVGIGENTPNYAQPTYTEIEADDVVVATSYIGPSVLKVSSARASTSIQGANCTYSALFTPSSFDNDTMWRFDSNNTGTFVIGTWNSFNGNGGAQWANETITNNASAVTVQWQIIANDTDGNIVGTGLQNLTLSARATGGSSPFSYIIIGVVAGIALIVSVVLLMFRRKLKTKPRNLPPPTPNSSLVSAVQLSRAGLSQKWCKMVISLIFGFGGRFDAYSSSLFICSSRLSRTCKRALCG